jgi:hypothetical protein
VLAAAEGGCAEQPPEPQRAHAQKAARWADVLPTRAGGGAAQGAPAAAAAPFSFSFP